MTHRRWFFLAASILLSCAPVAGGQAEDVFNSLYGNDFEKVKASRDKADDVALAGRLLEAARAEGTRPALAAILCEKTLELGSAHPDGYDTAIDAADLLAETAPAKRASAYTALVDLREKQHRAAKGIEKISAAETLIEMFLLAADAQFEAAHAAEAMGLARRALRLAASIKSDRKAEIQVRMDQASARLRVERELETLKTRLQANPKDAATRNKAVWLCLVELDDPAQARTLLDDSCEKSLLKYVPAVSKGVEAAPKLACMELGEWYRGQADSAGPAGKAAMLKRARAYYQRFLDLHEAEDLSRNQATIALQKVNDELAKLAPASESKVLGPGRWIDLLARVDLAKDVVEGKEKWRMQAGELVYEGGWPDWSRVRLPCAPVGDYQIKVRYVRLASAYYGVVILPVGTTGVVLILGGDGDGRGLANANPAPDLKTPFKLTNKHEYEFDIKVVIRGRVADLSVTANGKPYLHWQGAWSGLSVLDRWRLPDPKVIGLGVESSKSVFKGARLRMLTGKAILLRPAPRAAGAPAKGARDQGASAGRPLLLNTGFEEVVEGAKPNRSQWQWWGCWSWGGDYENHPEDRPEYVHSGKRSARITCTGKPGRIGVITQKIPVDPKAAEYLFTVWAKGEGENELFVNFESGAGGELHKRIGSDWEKVTVKGTLKEGAKDFLIYIYVTGRGTIWLDDAALLPQPRPAG